MPRAKAVQCPQRDKIEHLLVETDLPHRQIAARLGIACGTVHAHAFRIFRRHHVKDRPQLKALLRHPTSQ